VENKNERSRIGIIIVIILIGVCIIFLYQWQSKNQSSVPVQIQNLSQGQGQIQSLSELNSVFNPVTLRSVKYTFAGDTFTFGSGSNSSSGDDNQSVIEQGHTDYSPTDPNFAASYYTAGNVSSSTNSISQLSPVGYVFATSSVGNIAVDSSANTVTQGAIVAMYRNWGANIIMPVIFAVEDIHGVSKQVAAGIVDNQEDAEIQSVSIAHGIIMLNLLVVSLQDQQTLPHYEWKPDQPLSLTFKIVGDQLVSL
jgi:hypothetical protein